MICVCLTGRHSEATSLPAFLWYNILDFSEAEENFSHRKTHYCDFAISDFVRSV